MKQKNLAVMENTYLFTNYDYSVTVLLDLFWSFVGYQFWIVEIKLIAKLFAMMV